MELQEQQALSPSSSTDKEEETTRILLEEKLNRLGRRSKLQTRAIVHLHETVEQQESKIEVLQCQWRSTFAENSNLRNVVKHQESKIKLLKVGLLQREVSDEILTREIGILRNQLYKVTYDDTTFANLNLSPELMKGLVEMKFPKPSKFQAITLPMIFTHPFKDLIAQGHIGSGKTTCFVLGMLSRVDPNLNKTQALCICPTPERSIQNLKILQKMGKYTEITSESAIPMESGEGKPKFPGPISAQIVIGTPATIKRLMSQKKLSVTDLKVLVFDEADHMLTKDGFQDDSLKIMKYLKRGNVECQVLLFSATFDESVNEFVNRTVKKDHNSLFARKEELSLDSVKQYKVTCSDEMAKIVVVKDRILEFAEKMGKAVILVNSKHSAAMLHKLLNESGYEVTNIHCALNPEDRDKIVKEFKDGLTQVLISTDLIARGFDQQEVNLVVNYDLPVKFENPSEPNYEVYLHRVGRAGRWGGKGAVFSFVMDSTECTIMEKIDNYIGGKIIEVPPSNSEEDFKVAMKAAGLM